MGMFDYVRCDYPLPNGKVGAVGQTKDFDCSMVTHVIDAEGKFWEDHGKCIETPREEKPYPDAEPGSIYYLFGSLKHVPELVESTYTGSIWIEDDWCAVVVRGQLYGFESFDGKTFVPVEQAKEGPD